MLQVAFILYVCLYAAPSELGELGEDKYVPPQKLQQILITF
jgi:hypothetical protein